MVLSNLQGPLLCKTSLQAGDIPPWDLIVSVDNYEADIMDKYYEEQFMKKDQSLRIPEKANMQEYSERLETIVKRWGGEETVLLTAGRTVQQHPRHVWVRLGEAR